MPNEDILLLDEVLEMVDNADDFAVSTCDCRSLDENCEFPTETCIRFNEEAKSIVALNRGKRLTREKMRELVINLDKKGLIHTGNKNWKVDGPKHLCSCCACCCYPFRAGVELELKGLWPRSYYVASFDASKCTQCGACVKRCQFGAWALDDVVKTEGKTRKNVVYDAERCWGCGLCANSCPSKAITMKSLGVSPYPRLELTHVH
jgi:Pyruvate/2-oxoacid:ferredoxin oxidoreductase delta subunit